MTMLKLVHMVAVLVLMLVAALRKSESSRLLVVKEVAHLRGPGNRARFFATFAGFFSTNFGTFATISW